MERLGKWICKLITLVVLCVVVVGVILAGMAIGMCILA